MKNKIIWTLLFIFITCIPFIGAPFITKQTCLEVSRNWFEELYLDILAWFLVSCWIYCSITITNYLTDDYE